MLLMLISKAFNCLEHFKHIIISRFNLSKRWKKDKSECNVLSKDWLDHRYQLFKDFCLPSIKSQTSQNFEWWVYFDKSLETEYKIWNEKLNEDFPNFIPKYEGSYDDFEVNMPKELQAKLIKEKIRWLITTRLDNDDVLARDTVAIIQNNVNFDNLCLMEVPYGYTLEIKETSVLRKVTTFLNPFISLVEKVSTNVEVRSVYYQQHNKWTDVKKMIISKKAQWIQIIHDKNIINYAFGEEVSPLRIKKRFIFNSDNLKFKPLYVFYIKWLKIILTKIKKYFETFC
jgi:hypothetical protein